MCSVNFDSNDDFAKDGPALRQIRSQVDGWVRDRKEKQASLAERCGVDAADFARFLAGQHRSFPLYALANLAVELGIDPAQLLLRWESSQCARRLREPAEKEAGTAESTSSLAPTRVQGWKNAQGVFRSILQRLPKDHTLPAPPTAPRTLLNWPHSFLPLVVFVGDRREMPPKSPADLLAASASMGDLYYLPKLQLPSDTEIRSDKTAIIASEDSLRSIAKGKNLLVIGSPAANLVAREVNSSAYFSFHATSEALAQAQELQAILEPHRYYEDELERYAGLNCVTESERNWSRRRKHMIFGFARSGILDPIDYEGLRGRETPASLDYGVVSLCPHPWSEGNVAIMAGGLHGPATAAAIKMLARPDAFHHRPLGGVFRVQVSDQAPWETRYQRLEPKWETHEYSISEYEQAVKEFMSRHARELDGEFRFWKPTQVLDSLGALATSVHEASQGQLAKAATDASQ
jgi:hypothetical protein